MTIDKPTTPPPVARYDIQPTDHGYPWGHAEPVATGKFVLARDYDLLAAECERLRKLVMAIKDSDVGGVYFTDVDGVNWFDARKKALTPTSQETEK